MACGDPRPKFSTEPVQIQATPRTLRVESSAKKSRRRLVKEPVVPRHDFHCEICGHTGPHKDHSCPGKRLISYHQDRLAKCDHCKYNEDRICTLYKSQHPDRDCNIDIGITLPEARCPAGLWDRCLYKCEKCKAVSFNENGLNYCPKCKQGERKRVSMPFKFVNHKEPPLQATSDLLVITIATGQKALELLELTGPPMKAYADRCGADFHAITNNLVPKYPIGNKFRLKNLTTNYKRVLFLDVDVWVRSTAQDLFKAVPEGTLGIHMDYPFSNNAKWAAKQSNLTAIEQHVDQIPLRLYNTGVVVFDSAHSAIWTHPPLPAKPRHLTEQVWVEYTIARLGIPLTLLDPAYNTQWWFQSFNKLEPQAKIVHLAGCGHGERLFRFKKYQWAAKNEATV